MAAYTRATGDTKNPVTHARDLFHETLRLTSLAGFMGKKGSGKPIIMDSRLRGKAGDTIRYEFIPHNYADGLFGQDVTILGNESSFSSYSLDLTIDEVNHAMRKKGKMTDQRIIFSAREEMKRMIVNLKAQYNEDALFRTLTGITATDESGADKLVTDTNDRVQGSYRCWRASGSNDAAVVTAANSDNVALDSALASAATDLMSPQLIDEAVTTLLGLDAEDTTNISYRMKPIKVGPNNEEYFVLFLSPVAAKDLRYNPEWQAHSYSLADRGLGGKDDLIGRGALGVWNNVIIKQSQHVRKFASTAGTFNYARNLLLGADAMVCGWAQTLMFTEEKIDHNRELSMNGSEIRGEVKVSFPGNDGSTQVDMGVAQLVSVG